MYISIGRIVRSWIIWSWVGLMVALIWAFFFGFGIGILAIVLGRIVGIGWLDAGSCSSWSWWLKAVTVVAWVILSVTIYLYTKEEERKMEL